jgi:predicted amidohydrolase YtcJ
MIAAASASEAPAVRRRPLGGQQRENAKQALQQLIPSNFTRDDRREAVKLISRMMSRTGVTSVTDALGGPEDLRAYQEARDAGDLSLRVYCHIYYAYMDQMLAAGVRTRLGDEWGPCRRAEDDLRWFQRM